MSKQIPLLINDIRKGISTISDLSLKIRGSNELKKELYKLTHFLSDEYNMSSRVYCIINDIKETPTCSCGKPLRFLKINRGFYKTCGSQKCLSKAYSESAIKGNNRDWKISVDRMKETHMKKTGFESNLSAGSAGREKAEKNMYEKHGVKSPLKNKDILKKQQKSLLENHGSLNMIGSEKSKKTILEKYGVNHPMKNEGVKKKSKNNCIKTKNIILFERMKIMNLDIIQYDYPFYNLYCQKCGNEISNVTRYLINYSFRNDISPCHVCYPINHFRSKSEIELGVEIKKIYDGEIQFNRKYLGFEIDIILPEKKIAIEFNGLYWHSELYKEKNYHINKKIAVEKKGYKLIQIWEDDWNHIQKRRIIMSRLKNIIGNSFKIYARKTEIKEIGAKESKRFLKKNHLKGNVNASIRIGLLLNDKLVYLMTFGKSRNSIGGKKEGYELLRNCTIRDHVVIGGFSKIINYFKGKYGQKIFSYADCDWTTIENSSYEKIGFKNIKHTSPGWHWVINGKRENRLNFQKHKLINMGNDSSLSAIDIMSSKGYYRVFNSGNLLMELVHSSEYIK